MKLGVPGGFLENPKVKIPLPPALDQVAKLIRLRGGATLDGLYLMIGKEEHVIRQKPSAAGSRLVAWFALLMIGNLPAIGFTQSPCPGIHVRILNIRNSTGTIDCALFASPDGFPKEFLHSAIVVMVLKIKRTEARCDFEDIPTGTYALAVIHDENMNGKLDTNLLGIPKEGYGFSNDVKAARGAPSFSDASFPYDGQDLNFTLSLHY